MSGEEAVALTGEIGRVRRICKVIRIVTTALLVLAVIVWVPFLILMLFGMIDEMSSVPPGSALYIGLLGLDIMGILFFALKIFKAAELGEPFSRLQVYRLRIISGLLVLYVVIEWLFAVDALGVLVIAGYEIGLSGGGVSPNDSLFVNASALFMAIAIYCVSFIFQYGSLLQEMSDETV